MAKKSSIGAHRKLSGFTTPKIGFRFAYSNMDPTCKVAKHDCSMHVQQALPHAPLALQLRSLMHAKGYYCHGMCNRSNGM